MLAKDIINEKLVKLKKAKEANKELSNDVFLVNKWLESLNTLGEETLELDVDELSKVLSKYGFKLDGLSELIKNIKNLVEYYVVIKKQVLILPNKYEKELNKLKDDLKDIKEKITNKLDEYENIDKDIPNLEKLIAFLNNENGSVLTEGMLQTLYDVIIKDGRFEDFLPLYKELYEHDESKKFEVEQKPEKQEETMILEKKIVTIDDVRSLLSDYFDLSLFEKELNTFEKEIITSIDLDNARKIIEFFKEKSLLKTFNTEKKALLKLITCGNIKDIETMYERIKMKLAYYDISIKEFLTSTAATVWININDSAKIPKKKGRKGYNSSPNGLHANYMTFDDVCENILLLESNKDILQEQDDSVYYKCSIVKMVNPIILRRNLSICRLLGMTSVALSALQEDLEVKLHKVIELGLLNPPLDYERFELDNKITGNDGFSFKGKSKYDVSIRNYYNRHSTSLVDLSSRKMAYLFYKLSKGKSVFYDEFFTESGKKDGSKQLFSKQELDYIKDDKNFEKISGTFIVNEDVIPSYSTYNEDICEYEEKDRELESVYYDKEILEDGYIRTLEEDNRVYDEYVAKENGQTVDKTEKNEYLYDFFGKKISRYKVLRNASILKHKYGELTEDMVLAAIARNSYITSDELEDIRSSVKRREL